MNDRTHQKRRRRLTAAMMLALLPIDRARAQAAGFVPQALPVERIAAERLAEDGTAPPLHKPIHSTGELLPVIGLPAGTCSGPDTRTAVLTPQNIGYFMRTGGRVIHLATDCDEMQRALGETLARSPARENLFTAIRIADAETSASAMRVRIDAVLQRLRIAHIDLVCLLHDIDGPAEPLATLYALKKDGRIRHVGIAPTPGRSAGLEQILKQAGLDFIETGYALDRREADRWLLPFALEHEIAVLATSPFGDGILHRTLQRHELPKWSADFGCTSWNQFFLKYVASHPAVTCVIPDGEQAASLFSSAPLPGGQRTERGDTPASHRTEPPAGTAAAGHSAASLIADYAAAARNPMPDAIERRQMERFVDARR